MAPLKYFTIPKPQGVELHPNTIAITCDEYGAEELLIILTRVVEQISQEKLADTTLEPNPNGYETVKFPAPESIELHREPKTPRIGTITMETRELRAFHRQLGKIIEQLDRQGDPIAQARENYALWQEINR